LARSQTLSLLVALSLLGPSTGALAQQTTVKASVASTTTPAWIQKSNANAKVLGTLTAKFNPEFAGNIGVEGVDDQIVDLKPGIVVRSQAATVASIKDLESRLAREKDPLVRQDLDILLKTARNLKRGNELNEKYEIPYFNMSRLVFGGLRGLLDDQVSPERRKIALTRLKRYAGMELGYSPITELAKDRTNEYLNKPGLTGPARIEVEKDLATSQFFVEGIGKLFEKYKVEGYQEAYSKLKEQLTAYEGYVRKEILPRTRADFRLPKEVYAFNLENFGVDLPPDQLAAQAHAAFDDLQKQMQILAPIVAKEKGYSVSDYRDVIRELKKDQLLGEAILPHYQMRLGQIEEIIRREKIVTLPERAARIRIASAAESAQQPAPNMRPPRLLGNTGEQGEFVLPLNVPPPVGSKEAGTQRVDDFTYAAASWTLTAHEARPGHELQFASIIEKGVSVARAVYSFNSTNVEGWGLYSEYIMRPYFPNNGRLISLQLQLLRSARAFLDPELQSGKITPAQALELLTKEVGLSPTFANQEVERYTFRAPGQATTYFYGYTKLIALRAETEKALGKKFDALKYHDFILAQGLLPPDLLRKTVLENFVPQQLKLDVLHREN
jgi:hypothetical protein